jgi:TRAP-type C4-dicarboxylate transport system permease small subunit
MVQRSFSVPTITLFFSWAYVYLAAPISAIIMFLYSLLHYVHYFVERKNRKARREIMIFSPLAFCLCFFDIWE